MPIVRSSSTNQEASLNRDNHRPLDLLSAGPLITPGDRKHVAEGLERAYRVRRVDFGPSEAAMAGLANRIDLREVTLHFCRYEAETHIAFPRMEGFRQFFCLSGSGEISVGGRQFESGPHHTGIVPPDSNFEARYGAGYSHLVVQFSEAVLLNKLELLEGRSAPARLDLPVFQTLDAAKVWRLRETALALAAQFDSGAPPNRLLASEMAQALVSSFLIENRAAFSGLLAETPRRAGRGDMRRLEDYIQAHWDQPLTVPAVAEACGVSVRSVFARFKDQHGVSPLTYMRDVRLDRARDMLCDPDSHLSVIDVAMRCGFASFGHFARRYRDRFGELPSATLASRR
jgi:AraC-like DNA-binding protein